MKVLRRALISSFHCFVGGVCRLDRLGELNSEKNQLLRFEFLSFFATFKITPRIIKMLFLHILQADSTENWKAFCKLIVLNNHKISKKSKKSVLRYIENITGSVGYFVKCRSSVRVRIAEAVLTCTHDIRSMFEYSYFCSRTRSRILVSTHDVCYGKPIKIS